jgi:uncharacterized protein with von Willebrand factor type A (vWA) domain
LVLTALLPASRIAEPFISFATLLRAHGFPVAAEQTIGFLTAIPLLGPRDIADIHAAAHALFGPPPERHIVFDALFRAHFLKMSDIAQPMAETPGQEDVTVRDDAPGLIEPPAPDGANETGETASAAERLGLRRLDPHDETAALRLLARVAPHRLPSRRSHRFAPASRGRVIDIQRTLREQARRDGEVIRLPRRRRKLRRRALLLLIDVSGSMKERTDAHLRFTHTLARATDRVEVFTIGTRLTRITRAIGIKPRNQALAAAADLVADWDGGTRLGDALGAFLAVPRFATYARGAYVLVLSDGLERGDHTPMVDAVRRLSRLAWRVSWLSPLAGAADFVPETAAMQAIRPLLHDVADGGSTKALVAHMLRAADRRSR